MLAALGGHLNILKWLLIDKSCDVDESWDADVVHLLTMLVMVSK